MKYTKSQLMVLFFTILYMIIFAFIFIGRKNYEFLGYVVVLVFFIFLIGYLHLKFNFTTGVLLGMSFWGLMHMAGGGIIIDGSVLYAFWLIPGILKYDMAVHAYGFVIANLISFYILKPYFGKIENARIALSIYLVFIGMGLGALNEIIEFTATLIIPDTGVGGYKNTMLDIVFNAFGSLLMVIYINLSGKFRE